MNTKMASEIWDYKAQHSKQLRILQLLPRDLTELVISYLFLGVRELQDIVEKSLLAHVPRVFEARGYNYYAREVISALVEITTETRLLFVRVIDREQVSWVRLHHFLHGGKAHRIHVLRHLNKSNSSLTDNLRLQLCDWIQYNLFKRRTTSPILPRPNHC